MCSGRMKVGARIPSRAFGPCLTRLQFRAAREPMGGPALSAGCVWGRARVAGRVPAAFRPSLDGHRMGRCISTPDCHAKPPFVSGPAIEPASGRNTLWSTVAVDHQTNEIGQYEGMKRTGEIAGAGYQNSISIVWVDLFAGRQRPVCGVDPMDRNWAVAAAWPDRSAQGCRVVIFNSLAF